MRTAGQGFARKNLHFTKICAILEIENLYLEVKVQMFEVNAYLMYAKCGVCQVEAVGEPQCAGLEAGQAYYTLRPVYGNETIFLPVDAKVALRPILARTQAEALLGEIPALLEQYAAERPKMEQRALAGYYRDLLKSGEALDALRLLGYIYGKRQGKPAYKLCQTDRLYAARAEELLSGELAVALGVPREEIAQKLSPVLA